MIRTLRTCLRALTYRDPERLAPERERLARRLASAKPRSHAAAALQRDLQRVTHAMLRAEARVARWMGVRG